MGFFGQFAEFSTCVRSRANLVVQRFTTDEHVHFIMNILGDGVESNDKNRFLEEGNTDSDYPEESVEEASKRYIEG